MRNTTSFAFDLTEKFEKWILQLDLILHIVEISEFYCQGFSQKFRQSNVLLKNFTINWFDGKKFVWHGSEFLFHTVLLIWQKNDSISIAFDLIEKFVKSNIATWFAFDLTEKFNLTNFICIWFDGKNREIKYCILIWFWFDEKINITTSFALDLTEKTVKVNIATWYDFGLTKKLI